METMQYMTGNHTDDVLSSAGSDIKPIYIMLLDISGYTRFIRFHKISLLHAEKIIGELMESILREVEVPIMTHEILGDAISLYAVDENKPGQADNIYFQLEKYFNAFRSRESELISACNLCKCDACRQVGQLHLKAILHYGHAAFTKVHTIQKISGEDVIIAHRLLKNSLNLKDYILLTGKFLKQSKSISQDEFQRSRENYQDIGNIEIFVKNNDTPAPHPKTPIKTILKDFFKMEVHLIKRIFKKEQVEFKNIPYSKG